MVLPLKPGKFYGSSLPRPHVYTDVKFSEDRVDPPVSILDPFLTWAKDAHWSMGGLSFKRVRFQGKIEGNLVKLRAEGEKRNVKMEMLRAEAEDEIEKKKKKNKMIETEKVEIVKKTLKKKNKMIETEKKVDIVKKKGKGKKVESPPVLPSLRRSKRRKLVLRDEDDDQNDG